MISISDEDIKFAEGIFLPEGASFDAERVDVIKCMISKDIQACPGSGKTTTLLAKLAILAQKMPLEGNKGICVLTHTNVAINEIKDKLGSEGNILFRYPNYIGTFQSFVDKFLATPANLHYYGNKPSIIDPDTYNYEMSKKFYELGSNHPLRKWLLARFMGRKDLGYPEKVMACRKLFLDMRVDFVNGKIKQNLNADKALLTNKNDKYEMFTSIKEDLFRNGILNYDDAYSLAFRYLDDFGNILEDCFSKRFAFVFIDEMQDTDYHQNDLINLVFNDTKIIVQKFGDANQSIYDHSAKEDIVWDVKENNLCINGSKRFSESIASCVKHICKNPQEIVGNSSIENIPPLLLIYDNTTIRQVIPTFSRIIIEQGLNNDENIFKAVGWVGQVKGVERTLPSYFPSYHKKSISKSNCTTLGEYLKKIDSEQVKIQGANCYRKAIIDALLKVLKIYNVKNEDSRYFTATSLIKYIKEKDIDFYQQINLELVQWCLKKYDGIDITNDLKTFIECDFANFFNITDLKALTSFFEIQSTEESQINCQNKLNVYKDDDSCVEIEVSTVHSVKGETHSATLYLETYYNRGYDVKRILAYLQKSTHSPNSITSTSLKMCYVGMTRPTHLLCVAAHHDSIKNKEDYLQENGWEIRYLTEEIQSC